MSSKNSQLSALIETALVAAFAMALSYIPDFASWFTLHLVQCQSCFCPTSRSKIWNSSWSYLGLASLYFR